MILMCKNKTLHNKHLTNKIFFLSTVAGYTPYIVEIMKHASRIKSFTKIDTVFYRALIISKAEQQTENSFNQRKIKNDTKFAQRIH